MATTERVEELRREVEELDWYHTFELAPGVETPGWFDLRGIVPGVLPASLTGQRCLDVGTFDGFWAFAMEERGASEVLAIDVNNPYRWDWPVVHDEATVAALAERKREGVGFELIHGLRASAITRRELSIYDLDPDDVGKFDLVYVGSLLLHLRDPIRGLEAVRSVCDGKLIVCDAIDLGKTRRFPRQPIAVLDGRGRPWWWKPNLAGLSRMVEAAGFELIERPRRLYMTLGDGHPKRSRSLRALVDASAREELFTTWRGEPHGVIVARPAGKRSPS